MNVLVPDSLLHERRQSSRHCRPRVDIESSQCHVTGGLALIFGIIIETSIEWYDVPRVKRKLFSVGENIPELSKTGCQRGR